MRKLAAGAGIPTVDRVQGVPPHNFAASSERVDGPIQHWRETVKPLHNSVAGARAGPSSKLRNENGDLGDNPHHVSFDPVLHPELGQDRYRLPTVTPASSAPLPSDASPLGLCP